jgi:hypothetical protein
MAKCNSGSALYSAGEPDELDLGSTFSDGPGCVNVVTNFRTTRWYGGDKSRELTRKLAGDLPVRSARDGRIESSL